MHLEPYKDSADPRSRTARVDQGTRAILAATGTADTYILVKVLPHDQADRWMAHNRFNVNQLTGALEVIDVVQLEALPGAIPAGPPAPARGALDGVPDKAFAQLGITAQRVIAVARMMPTAEDVEVLAGALPDDQADALIGLATGMSVNQIYAEMLARLEPADRTPTISPRRSSANRLGARSWCSTTKTRSSTCSRATSRHSGSSCTRASARSSRGATTARRA